jgi:hypothetical protein
MEVRMVDQDGMPRDGGDLAQQIPNIFDPRIPDELSGDFPAAFHEAGHAVLWLSCGGIVQRFRFRRNQRGLLGGKTVLAFPPGQVADTERNACLAAERLLAGECAARAALVGQGKKFSREHVCSYEVVVDPKGKFEAVIQGLDEFRLKLNLKGEFDIAGVVGLAGKWGGANWYAWVCERLMVARRRVDANWEAITDVAGRLLIRVLPKGAGPVIIVEGEELDRVLSELHLQGANYQIELNDGGQTGEGALRGGPARP